MNRLDDFVDESLDRLCPPQPEQADWHDVLNRLQTSPDAVSSRSDGSAEPLSLASRPCRRASRQVGGPALQCSLAQRPVDHRQGERRDLGRIRNRCSA